MKSKNSANNYYYHNEIRNNIKYKFYVRDYQVGTSTGWQKHHNGVSVSQIEYNSWPAGQNHLGYPAIQLVKQQNIVERHRRNSTPGSLLMIWTNLNRSMDK